MFLILSCTEQALKPESGVGWCVKLQMLAKAPHPHPELYQLALSGCLTVVLERHRSNSVTESPGIFSSITIEISSNGSEILPRAIVGDDGTETASDTGRVRPDTHHDPHTL